jgi:ubiquinone/menaquinone biosynthesis C-methylase UbiE
MTKDKTFRDKHGVMESLAMRSEVIVELGCGNRKRRPDAIGIDQFDADAVDLVGDVIGVLQAFPDYSVHRIESYHVLEHVEDLPILLKEISRVLVLGGEMFAAVPHFTNPFFYSDPTHKNPFGLYTFAYYCKTDIFKRTVPRYSEIAKLELVKTKLVFNSFRPRYVTHAFRKVLQVVFNVTPWLQEIYEDSFSRLFSCYEIQYWVRKSEL